MGEDVAKPRLGHFEGNVGIGLLIRGLHGPLARAVALDDADDLEVLAADEHELANGGFGGQETTGAMLGEHHHIPSAELVLIGEHPTGQDGTAHQTEP